MTTNSHKIFVQTCCTACLSYVYSQLKLAGFEVISYYFHPEIGSQEEFDQRLTDLRTFCEENKIKLVVTEFQPHEFEKNIIPFKDRTSLKFINDKERYRRRRCQICNSMILQKTIEQAKKLRIKYFTTTLLCSPYKDHSQIIEISNEKSLDYNLNFYYEDFRKGYWKGRNYGRNHDVYLPTHCGCLESLKERRLE
jgi:hypothetical protein